MKKLRQLIDSIFDEGYDKVANVSHFRDTENWDSLRYMKLVVAIQVEFGIELNPEEIQKIISVAAVEAVLKSRGAEF
jgi:acyl carrier protein